MFGSMLNLSAQRPIRRASSTTEASSEMNKRQALIARGMQPLQQRERALCPKQRTAQGAALAELIELRMITTASAAARGPTRHTETFLKSWRATAS